MKKISLVIIILLLFPTVVFAQNIAISVSSDTAVISFPNSISFKAEFKSNSDMNSVKLFYGTLQDTCGNVIAIAFPEFTAGKSVVAEWLWDMRQTGSTPPGANIWWQWEVKDSSGNTLLTEKKNALWLDDVHSWKVLSQGMIRLHYYLGDGSFGETLKDAAVSALDRLGNNIGIKADQPIDLYIYGDSQGMRNAVLYEPGWTGGLAFSEFNVVIIGISPAQVEWGKSTIAHELTHVLVGDFTFSCLGSVPTWLVEGIAVYGEGGPEPSEVSSFEINRSGNTLLSFKILSGGFSEDPTKADLSYTQSYYMVNYLIEKYGKDKLITFFGKLKTGGELNDSMQSTYGFNLIGFENEWRVSLNLPAIKESATQATPTPTHIPTIIPIQGFKPAATISPQSAAPTTGVNPTWVIVLVGIGITGFLLVALLIIRNNRKKKAASQAGDRQ